MKEPPLVSVLMPAYNHERYVQEAIRSIIAQTYLNIELIVIDDGSPDATFRKIEELLPECEARFVRVVARTQPNAGTCDTCNRLIDEAKGDYILLLASDDAITTRTIETEVRFMESHPDYVLVVGDGIIMDADSRRIGWDRNQKATPLESAPYKSWGGFLMAYRADVDFHSDSFGSYASLVPGNYIPNGYLIRAAALKQMGGFTKAAPLEDYYMMLQLAKQGKMKYLDDTFCCYRWHDNNTVKRLEHMRSMSEQTFLYEYRVVCRKGMGPWRKIYADSYIKGRFKCGALLVRLQLGPLLARLRFSPLLRCIKNICSKR